MNYGVLFQSDELQLIFCNWCTIISLDDSWDNYSIYMFSRNESNCLREKLFKREVITSNFASGNQEVISIITQKLYERITTTTETCELKGLSAGDLTIQKIYFRV